MRINTASLAAATSFVMALSQAVAAQGPTIKLLDYQTTVPAKWVSRPPTSTARLAMFTVPGADTANNAEVVVYSFGNTPGGNVAANLERWRSQFSTPDGSPVPEKVTRDSSGAFPITIAEYRGTYRRGISHVGIYIGDNKMIHAANQRRDVRIDTLSGYYERKYWGARRLTKTPVHFTPEELQELAPDSSELPTTVEK